MTKEDKQIIDRAVKENWRIGDRTRLKHLLKKNLTLYRENVELEKENAELKSEKGCETCTKFDEVQLTKAKEIIKELYEGLDKLYLSGLSDKQIAFIERLQDKTEQFLKECK